MKDDEIVSLISKLAQEVEVEDSIDWGDLSIKETTAFDIMASEIFEKFKETENQENDRIILLATITKLVVENFVLNLKLNKMVQKNGKEII